MSDAFSPIMMAGALVLPEPMAGMIDEDYLVRYTNVHWLVIAQARHVDTLYCGRTGA